MAKSNSRAQQKRKKRGFTDRMYIYNVCFVTAIVIISFAMMIVSINKQIDISALNVIIPSAFAELGIHTGFIVWKAKAENISKFSKSEKFIETKEKISELENL